MKCVINGWTVRYDNDDAAPLYRYYTGECQLQPAYLEINPEDRTIDVYVQEHVGGGMSPEVFSGEAKRFSVSPYLSRDGIDSLVRKVIPFGDSLEDDCAVMHVESICESAEGTEVISEAYDWITGGGFRDVEIAVKELLQENGHDVDKAMQAMINTAAADSVILVAVEDLRQFFIDGLSKGD